MKKSIKFFGFVALLFLTTCSFAFASERSTVTDVRQRSGVNEIASRTPDPAAPFSFASPEGGSRRGGNPLDATGTLMWQTSDPTGMMNNLAISGDGSIAAIAIDLNNSRLQVYNGETGALIYEVPAADQGSWGSVAVSNAGDEIAYCTGSLLYLLPPTDSTPIWLANMGAGIAVYRVAMSRDGQHILAMESATTQNQDSIHVWSFVPASSTPVWTQAYANTASGGIMGATYSADGSHLVVTARNHLYVMNLEDGTAIWDTVAFNTEHPAGVSGDGRVISYGSNNDGKIRVFHWDPGAQTYVLLWNYTFTGGSSNWGTATAISANGETVAGGSLQFTSTGNAGYFAVFDTYGGGTPLWTPVDMEDLVGGVQISDDGITVAAISWGPLNDGPADIQVFDKHSSTPFYTYAHPGSPNDLAMTPDGTRLFAGGKAVHNRMFGNGGNAYLFGLDLEGGTVNGSVAFTSPGNFADVIVETQNGVRHTLTDALGSYSLSHIPAGTYTIVAHKLGFTSGQVPNVVLTDGSVVNNINFALDTADVAPTGLAASPFAFASEVQLTWNPATLAGLRQREHDKRVAAGDDPFIDLRGPVAIQNPVRHEPFGNPSRDPLDDLDDADSIRVWRSAVSGGPYAPIAALPGTATSYSDDLFGLLPGQPYYYVVTAVYTNGESVYSNEAMGGLNDDYLNFTPTVPPATSPVTFDGVISGGEWTDAISVDISDAFGYDGQDLPGTVFMHMKYDDVNDMLLVATEDHANAVLDSAEGFGFYVDDDNSDSWTYTRPGSEGNYWAYWFASGPTLRFRSLTGNGSWGSTIYQFPNPQLAFSAAAGYVTMEVAIPLGFHYGYQIALYGPNRTPGVGAFVIQRDGPNPIYHGWWPQNVPSIVSNPEYFSNSTIDAQLFVPPLSPSNITVEPETNSIQITWDDPTLGIDSLPVLNLDGINIYRNGEFMDVVPPATELWIDPSAEFGGWYEYSLAGFIPEDTASFEGPHSYPIGAYMGSDPEIQDVVYDDNEFDFYSIVSGVYEGNKEAVKFELPAGTSRVYTAQLRTNSTAPIGISVVENTNSRPGATLAGPYFVSAPVAEQFFTMHIPGLDAPAMEADSFWIVLDWPTQSPADPAIATDSDQPYYGQSWYFTNSQGWNNISSWNLMIRAGVGTTITSSDPDGAAPVVHQFRLLDNYPNPFNPETTIPFELSANGDASLRIFNLLGQEVATLLSGPQVAGHHVAVWNGEDNSGLSAASGIYLVRLESQGRSATHKITLLK